MAWVKVDEKFPRETKVLLAALALRGLDAIGTSMTNWRSIWRGAEGGDGPKGRD